MSALKGRTHLKDLIYPYTHLDPPHMPYTPPCYLFYEVPI